MVGGGGKAEATIIISSSGKSASEDFPKIALQETNRRNLWLASQSDIKNPEEDEFTSLFAIILSSNDLERFQIYSQKINFSIDRGTSISRRHVPKKVQETVNHSDRSDWDGDHY